jgi:hypothetical protein
MKVHQRDGGDGLENCEAVREFKTQHCVAHLVTEDDSSVRKILTHSFKELLAASASLQKNGLNMRTGKEARQRYVAVTARNHPSWPTKAIESADLRFLFRGSQSVSGQRMPDAPR